MDVTSCSLVDITKVAEESAVSVIRVGLFYLKIEAIGFPETQVAQHDVTTSRIS